MSELPSRRYTCIACGGKGRRNNSPEQRLREPICPRCEKALSYFDRYAEILPFWLNRKKEGNR
jgi:hypothetical protein